MLKKEHWPKAFAEGKSMADEILRINREKKEYRKAAPGSTPSDRELLMAASVNVFWQYKLAQEASTAARIITWEKLDSYLGSKKNGLTWQGEEMELARLLKAVRRLKNNEADSAFLIMWGLMEEFLAKASNPAFWLKYEQPQHAILELRQKLVGMALGEDNGKEEREPSNETSGAIGADRGPDCSQGDSCEAYPGAMPGAGSESGSDRQGADEAGGGVQAGGGCLEATPGSSQNCSEEPQRTAPENLGGD